MTKSLKPVDVIETPDHFYYGGVDIPDAVKKQKLKSYVKEWLK